MKDLVYLNSIPARSCVIYSINKTRGMFSSAIAGLMHKKLEYKGLLLCKQKLDNSKKKLVRHSACVLKRFSLI